MKLRCTFIEPERRALLGKNRTNSLKPSDARRSGGAPISDPACSCESRATRRAGGRRSGAELGRARQAFTLIECLVYIAVFFIISGMAMAAFYRARDAHRDVRRCADDVARAMQAGERWRADVRAATGPARIEETDEGPLLRVPQRAGDILFVFRKDTVLRRAGTNTAWQEFLPRVGRSRMAADPRERVTAWRWELELATVNTNARVRPLFTFQAVVATEVK